MYHTSGAQGIPGGLSVDFVMMAKGAGYRMAIAIDDLGDSAPAPGLLTAEGPVLVELHTGLAEKTPMTVRERRRSTSSSTTPGQAPATSRERDRERLRVVRTPGPCMPLDPQAQRVVDAIAALNLKPTEESTPEEARESMRSRTAALGPFEDVGG